MVTDEIRHVPIAVNFSSAFGKLEDLNIGFARRWKLSIALLGSGWFVWITITIMYGNLAWVDRRRQKQDKQTFYCEQ